MNLRIIMIAVACWCAACSSGNKPISDVGVALYSFHRFSLEEGLQKAKQSGAGYVEGFSFHQVGGEIGDKSLSQLNESELGSVKSLIHESGLRMVSMYADGKDIAEWQMLFEQGKQLGLEFLVGEPQANLWDELDKLA